MERLKAIDLMPCCAALKNLHSSMERLKDHMSVACLPIPALFTFQYGEIKSDIRIRKRRLPAVIYIPVWRD